MQIIFNEQSPDGWNIIIKDLVINTTQQAFEVIRMVEAISKGQKIDIDECIRLFKETKIEK